MEIGRHVRSAQTTLSDASTSSSSESNSRPIDTGDPGAGEINRLDQRGSVAVETDAYSGIRPEEGDDSPTVGAQYVDDREQTVETTSNPIIKTEPSERVLSEDCRSTDQPASEANKA